MTDPVPNQQTAVDGDTFVHRAQVQIAELRKEEQRIQADQEALKERAATIQKRISDLSLALEVYRREMELPSPVAGVPSDLPTRSWADLAYGVMAKRGGRMKVADLVVELEGVPGRAEPKYATVYSSLVRDKERFAPVGSGEFEIRTPSDAEVLKAVAEAQLKDEFVGVRRFANQHAWHTKIGELIDRGLLERYEVPNPNGPIPTGAIRLVLADPSVREAVPPDLLEQVAARAD